MDACNRLTDLRGEGDGGDWKRLEHTCMYVYPMDTDNNV